MSLKNIVGWQIRRIRIAKGLAIDQLASALPKSSPLTSEQIAQMELGTRRVLDYQVQAISQALGVRLSDLFATPLRKRRGKTEPQ